MADVDLLGPLPGGPSEERTSRALECVISADRDPVPVGIPGVEFRELISGRCGARGISTGTVTFQPGARLPWHLHRFSEAVTILAGEASCCVQGRTYTMRPYDCMHIPCGTAHETRNASRSDNLVALWVFATETPTREPVKETFTIDERGFGNPDKDDPESLVRFNQAAKYALSPGTRFCSLFAARFGAVGIAGGAGELSPGSSLAYRVHEGDESVTTLSGEVLCDVAGRSHRLQSGETLFLPAALQHRFVNDLDASMTMLWARAAK